MLENFFYFAFFIILVGVFIIFIPSIYYRRKISRQKQKKYLKKINETLKKRISSREKIIIFDKILHNILLDLGYSGSLGEILKKEPSYLSMNLEKIWELHKLRNTLVHNIDEDFSDNYLFLKSGEYYKIIKFLLKDI